MSTATIICIPTRNRCAEVGAAGSVAQSRVLFRVTGA
jgi:hypothetical protein